MTALEIGAMQGSESYEWLLDSCLQECRKSISRLEQIASAAEKNNWLQEDLDELLALESAVMESLAALKTAPGPSDQNRNLTQEKLDRLQSKLLECFHHLASEGIPASNCP